MARKKSRVTWTEEQTGAVQEFMSVCVSRTVEEVHGMLRRNKLLGDLNHHDVKVFLEENYVPNGVKRFNHAAPSACWKKRTRPRRG